MKNADNENNNRRAARGQRRKIRAMLDNDRVSFALAQAIIEGNAKVMDDYDVHYIFFEKAHPGKGRDLMEIFNPLQTLVLCLQPALPDLEDRSRDVIFWNEGASIRKIYFREVDRLQDLLEVPLDVALREVSGLFEKDLSIKLLRKTYQATLKLSLWDAYKAARDAEKDNAYWVGVIDSNWESFERAIAVSLYLPLQLVLAGKLQMARKFKPLLALWLAGNYPLGFDKQGNLLVLVAE